MFFFFNVQRNEMSIGTRMHIMPSCDYVNWKVIEVFQLTYYNAFTGIVYTQR